MGAGRIKRQMAAAVAAAALVLGAAACERANDGAGTSEPPAVQTSATFVSLADVCRKAVDDLEPRTVAELAGRCDYRSADLGGPCPEDALCAVQVIHDTGDYPGMAATY